MLRLIRKLLSHNDEPLGRRGEEYAARYLRKKGMRVLARNVDVPGGEVDVLADVFKLTSEEKKRLSQLPVGQGLFFAGQNHVHIQVIASPTEAELITTTPRPVLAPQNPDVLPQYAPSSYAAAPPSPVLDGPAISSLTKTPQSPPAA